METGFSEVELNRFQKELQHVFDDELNRLQVELQDVFEDKVKREAWVEERGQDAQDAQVWLDRLHQLVYYPSISSQFKCSVSTTISQLSEMSGLYPTCLTIRKVRKIGDLPMAAGSLGPIWKCAIGKSTMPQTVGLKLVMMDYSNLSEQMRKFCQAFVVQVSVWRQLQHPNVLPLLGIYFFEGRRELCLISPWMEKGNLVAYVRSTPREDVDHYALAYDVANGLSYLHSKDIVHGELRGVNVLITSSGRACIGDFGVYPVALSHNLISLTEPSFAPVSNALWWLAPEGWRGAGPSKESDMYAYARVCYEIFSKDTPTGNSVAIQDFVRGTQPTRPTNCDAPELDDFMWEIMEKCLNTDPSQRPTADEVLQEILRYRPVVDLTLADTDWNDSLLSRDLWNHTIAHQVMTRALHFITCPKCRYAFTTHRTCSDKLIDR